jgi:hypothetical protein
MPNTLLGISSIDQVAVVVHDLDAAMERYWSELGIGPWAVYTYGSHRCSMTSAESTSPTS